MALWQPGDIVVSFRHSGQPPGPGFSMVAVWSNDGSTYRGNVELSPPLTTDAEALQNLISHSSILYGRELQHNPSIWAATGEQNDASMFLELQSAAGGIGIDSSGNIYIGDSQGPDSVIRKFSPSGTLLNVYVIDDNDPNLPGDPTPTCVKVSPDGSIIYFNTCMANWGTPVSESSAYINRYDTTSLGLIPPLDFTYNGGRIDEPQTMWHFDVGSDGRIYGLYERVDDIEKVFIAEPNGTVVADWVLSPGTNVSTPEAIAVNATADVVLVHENHGSAGVDNYFGGYDTAGNTLFRLHEHISVPSDFQPEGVTFIRSLVGVGGFFGFVTLVGAT